MRLAFLAALWPASIGGFDAAAAVVGAAPQLREDLDVPRSLLQVHVSVTSSHADSEAASHSQQLQGRREGIASTGSEDITPSLPPSAVQDCDYLRDSAGPGPCTTTTTTTANATGAPAAHTAQQSSQQGVTPSPPPARHEREQGHDREAGVTVPTLPPPAQHAADYVRDSTPGISPASIPPATPVAEGSEADFLRDGRGLSRLLPMAVVHNAERSLEAARAGLRRAELDAQAALRRCAALREAREAERRHVLATGAGAERERRLAEEAGRQERLLSGTLERALQLRRVVSQAIMGLNDTRNQTFTISWGSGVPCPTAGAEGMNLTDATSLDAIANNGTDTRTINITWDSITPLRDQLEEHLENLRSVAAEADALEDAVRRAMEAAADEEKRAQGALGALEGRLREHMEEEANLTVAYDAAQDAAQAIDVPAVARQGFEAVHASLLKLERAPTESTSTTEPPTSSTSTTTSSDGGSLMSRFTINIWGLLSILVAVVAFLIFIFLCIM